MSVFKIIDNPRQKLFIETFNGGFLQFKTNICGGVASPGGETMRREGRNLTAVGVLAGTMSSLDASVVICRCALYGVECLLRDVPQRAGPETQQTI